MNNEKMLEKTKQTIAQDKAVVREKIERMDFDEDAADKRRETAWMIRQLSQKRKPEYLEAIMEKHGLEVKRNQLLKMLKEAETADQTAPSNTHETTGSSTTSRDHGPSESEISFFNEDETTEADIDLEIDLSGGGSSDDLVLDVDNGPDLSDIASNTVIKAAPKTNYEKIRREIEKIDKQIEDAKQKMLDAFPLGTMLITYMYNSMYEEMLLEKKYIEYRGVEYGGPEWNEVAQEFTPEELARIDHANDLYIQIMPIRRDLMIIEIYENLYCAVFADGETRVYRE